MMIGLKARSRLEMDWREKGSLKGRPTPCAPMEDRLWLMFNVQITQLEGFENQSKIDGQPFYFDHPWPQILDGCCGSVGRHI